MDTSKLVPDDPRVTWGSTKSRGFNYAYQIIEPPSTVYETPKDTIILLHGFPDLSFGWRYQAPYLASLGYRVVVPDMLGYGRTDAPSDPAEYTFKRVSDDIAAIASAVAGAGRGVILGGHDWGGAIAWRVALWNHKLVKALFVACTPYTPPSNGTYHSLETLVERNVLPNFGYQLQLAGDEVESRVGNNPDTIRQFLRSMYGAKTPSGGAGFSTKVGLLFDRYMDLGATSIFSSEEMEYVVKEYARHGMGGPLNWYRTRKLNFDDEVALVKTGRTKIHVPSLFIAATHDTALPPKMSEGMESHFTAGLWRGQVDTTHWALEEAPQQVNSYIANFLQKLGSEAKL